MATRKMTVEQRRAGLMAIQAIAEAIRELGSVPSGELYAHVMSSMSLDVYNTLITGLKSAGLVTESANLLMWTGPKLEQGK